MKVMEIKKKTNHPYIISTSNICNGSPVVIGTRTRAIDIAIEYDKLGYTADQIIDVHPHLTLAQVHDALSYYYENQADIDRHMEINLAKIEEVKKRYNSKIKE